LENHDLDIGRGSSKYLAIRWFQSVNTPRGMLGGAQQSVLASGVHIELAHFLSL
jgi:hypothetical protein